MSSSAAAALLSSWRVLQKQPQQQQPEASPQEDEDGVNEECSSSALYTYQPLVLVDTDTGNNNSNSNSSSGLQLHLKQEEEDAIVEEEALRPAETSNNSTSNSNKEEEVKVEESNDLTLPQNTKNDDEITTADITVVETIEEAALDDARESVSGTSLVQPSTSLKQDSDVLDSTIAADGNSAGNGSTSETTVPLQLLQQPVVVASDVALRHPVLWRYTVQVPPLVSRQPHSSLLRWVWDVVVPPQQQQQQRNKLPPPSTTTLDATVSPLPPLNIPNANAISHCQEALCERLQQSAQELLCDLLWQAVLEECQACWYHHQQQQLDASTTKTSGDGWHNTVVPFSYYSATSEPTHSSSSSSTKQYQNDWTSSTTGTTRDIWTLPVSFTPAALLQRVKQGCLLAYQHQQQQQQQHQQYMTASVPTGRRSSSRIPPPALPASSSLLQPASVSNRATTATASTLLLAKPGGRVALFLLHHNKETTKQAAATTATANTDQREGKATIRVEPGNDTDPGSATADGSDDEVNVSEDEESDAVDEEDDLILKNPYLKPSRMALIEWLGKKSCKTWTTADVQPVLAEQMLDHTSFVASVPPVKSKKSKTKTATATTLTATAAAVGGDATELLTATGTDRLVWCQLLLNQSQKNNTDLQSLPYLSSSSQKDTASALADFLLDSKDARVVLQLAGSGINDDDIHDIGQWDISSFGRTQFTVRICNEVAAQVWNEHVQEQAEARQQKLKEQRLWETYRYKSIHTGFCQWGPTWIEAVGMSDLFKEMNGGEGGNSSKSTTAVATEAIIPSPDGHVSEDADFALAQSLAAQMDQGESSAVAPMSSTRRKTRRTGDGAGVVFYGNQSNLTQKQLLDAVLRLISSASSSSQKKPFLTMAGLLYSLPDDNISRDPINRIRTALGRLLFKRNQLSRIEVQTEWTDAAIRKRLNETPLWLSSPNTTTDAHEPHKQQQQLDRNDTHFSRKRDASLEMEDAQADSEDMMAAKPGATSDDSNKTLHLVDYIRTLHQTELQLRSIVLKHLSEIPTSLIATAADDRAGSMESMDDIDFEDPSTVQWCSSGHDLLSKRIFRPIGQQDTDETSTCYWFQVTDYVPMVATVVGETSANQNPGIEEASIGRAKEPTSVERRLRFRVVSVDAGLGGHEHNHPPMILTEAQVRAGIKAAEIEELRLTRSISYDNPFASAGAPEISLVPYTGTSENPSLIAGIVVGHDRFVNEDNSVVHKILVLPKKGSPTTEESFWATLDFSAPGGAISCQVEGDTKMYTIQQYDYHPSSKAFQECQAIVKFLQRHPKAAAFQTPVDPIALGIPEYTDIVKRPMDLSTLEQKLTRGDYSIIPSGHMKGQNPVVRMLNGPFRKDVERIFDNAMLFNRPNDYIFQAASVIKKSVIKKIEQASAASENMVATGRQRKHKSVYVDYDSDVDMYVYESDQDEDYGMSRKRKKRQSAGRTPAKEDAAARGIERGIRLEKILSQTMGVRGPLANLPIATNASDFTLPQEWNCRHKKSMELAVTDKRKTDNTELDELMCLHRIVEENEHFGLRRSTRASDDPDPDEKKGNFTGPINVEYIHFCCVDWRELPRNRLEVEIARERLHETYFAKQYQATWQNLISVAGDELSIGQFLDGLFPPFLGRVVPVQSFSLDDKASWEIREEYLVPAIRWVIRGLIHSEHLTQLGPQEPDLGVVIPNHIYYIDESKVPFDILDVKELTRRKRANDAQDQSSEDDVQLSEYEKARADRVARNAQRLQSLGLA